MMNLEYILMRIIILNGRLHHPAVKAISGSIITPPDLQQPDSGVSQVGGPGICYLMVQSMPRRWFMEYPLVLAMSSLKCGSILLPVSLMFLREIVWDSMCSVMILVHIPCMDTGRRKPLIIGHCQLPM